MIALAWLLLGLCTTAAAAPDERAATPDTVVLLHGLAQSDFSMGPLAARLRAAGFRTHAIRYDSDKESADLIADLGVELARCCADAPRLHFVTHSLGGVLLRAYLAEQVPPNLARVVMLAPPNHGSELADVVRRSRALRRAFGPTASELGTNPESLPNRLPPADFEVGVIAGTSTLNPVGSWLIPAEDDGTVSVASARLPGMADFVTLPVSHTMILLSSEAAQQTVSFLRQGRFDLAETEGEAVESTP